MASWQDYLGLLGYGTGPSAGILAPQVDPSSLKVDLSAINNTIPSIGPVAPDAPAAPANKGDFWSTKNPDGTTSILGGLFTYDPTKDTGRGDRMGLFGAALADAGAQFGGHPEAAVNLSRYEANRKQQAGQALLMDALNGMGGGTAPANIPAQQQAIGAPLAAGGGLATQPQPQNQAQAPSTSWNANSPGPTSGPIPIPPGSDHPNAPDPTDPSVLPPAARLPQIQPGNAQNAPQPFNLKDMLPKLARAQAAGVDVGPIVALLKDAQTKYSTTPQVSADGREYLVGEDGTVRWLDPSIKPRDKMEIAGNGAAYNPYQVQQGADFSDKSKPFNSATGTANAPVQTYEKAKIALEQAPAWANNKIAAAHLALDQQKMQAAIPSDDTLHDMALRYVSGDKTAAGSLSRNPMAQTAFQNMISQVGKEKGLTPQQISQNQQTFAAGSKAVQAFDTGKQGDTTRSLNVAVSHLSTLGKLADALGNGDYPAVNQIGQFIATQTGGPAPTNFNTAKQIVADEITKAVIGAGGTGGDREKAAAVINSARSPQQLKGAIQTYQSLLGGQLHGLRQQYQTSTGRDDFDSKLAPETLQTLSALTPPASSQAGPPNPASLPRLNPPAGTSGGVKWRIVPQGGR